jgi:hypothetical protein
MGEPLRPCRKKIVANASKNGEYVLTAESNVVQKYYVGSCRQLKRMSRSWSMCLPVLSLSVFIAPVCSIKVDDIWQCAGARLLRQNQLLEVIKDRVLARLAYKFPSQVMMECSYKFLFLSAFFRDIKYFFRASIKNGHVNLQMWVNELGFGSRKLKIWKYAGRLFPPLDPDHCDFVW